MSTKTINIKNYGATLRLDDKERREAVIGALFKAALIGEAIVANDTPVDTGLTRNQWTAKPTSSGAELFNDSPIAGILELGSRPHRPPFRPILEWVVRKFGTGKRSFEDYSEVDDRLFAIAVGVVRAIEQRGTKPNFMVKKNLGKLAKIAKREVESALSAHA